MKKILFIFVLFFVFSLHATVVTAYLIDFENMPDLTSVGDYYASYGLHFQNAISLTAGFSLNEIDYPPSSGLVAIGDDFAPIEIVFDSPSANISAYFTYGSQLTFTAYDSSGTLLGQYLHASLSNLGSTELIPLNFTNVNKLVIAGQWDGSYIMDDLSFAPIPEPASVILLAISCLSGAGYLRKRVIKS